MFYFKEIEDNICSTTFLILLSENLKQYFSSKSTLTIRNDISIESTGTIMEAARRKDKFTRMRTEI